MTDRSISRAWLDSWMSRVSAALKDMTDAFERRHGFPPGINEVRPADHDARATARVLARVRHSPADLVTFYGSIGEVAWADVGNGYFLATAENVLLSLKEHGAVEVGSAHEACGLVIGSNGGGQSYVTGPDGAVHRTRTASLAEPELDRVADDLRQFLELLEQALTRFATDDEPVHL